MMKKLSRIVSLTILLGIFTAWALTIPAFSDADFPIVGRWNFDYNTIDSSWKGNNGSLYPNIPYVYVPGVHRYGIKFNGFNYVQVPDSPSLNFGAGDFSISGWVTTTSTKTLNTIIDKRQTANGPGYLVALNNGSLLCQIGGSSGNESFIDMSIRPLLNDGALHSFAITVNHYPQFEVRFYIDGVLKRAFIPTSNLGSSSNTAPLYIGKNIMDSSANFVGLIDEIIFCDWMISANLVYQTFLNGSCTGKWGLDSSAVDSSGNENNGTLCGNCGFNYGRFGDELVFTGSNYVEIPNRPTASPGIPTLNFGTGDFSISFWAATANTKNNNTIIDKRATAGYQVTLSSGRLLLQIATAYNSGTFCNSMSQPLNDGFMHFVTITVDRDNPSGIKFYVDGTLTDTFNPTAYRGDISNTAPLYLGKHKDNPSDNFIGSLDEVKIYKRVLTPAEISLQYSGY
ncbi:MAG TPA: LamG-like jellyroll fold domain-containing protein [Bacillota bacterium]|nr:LamG-like jellyroll fold domain-containing protein [Bacillota bacterium]